MTTDRKELIDAGAKEIASHRSAVGGGWERDENVWLKYRGFAEWVLDAVEPMIRADEYGKCAARLDDMDYFMTNQRQNLLTSLHSKVKAMYDSRPVKNTAYTQALADVLALFGGGSE